MKWKEVRELYPNQFVKFEILESHIEDNKEYVDDVAIIKAISDGKEARKEFIKCKPEQLVYNTKNEELTIQLVYFGVRPLGNNVIEMARLLLN